MAKVKLIETSETDPLTGDPITEPDPNDPLGDPIPVRQSVSVSVDVDVDEALFEEDGLDALLIGLDLLLAFLSLGLLLGPNSARAAPRPIWRFRSMPPPMRCVTS